MTSDSLSFDNIIAIVPSPSQINHSDKWMKMVKKVILSDLIKIYFKNIYNLR